MNRIIKNLKEGKACAMCGSDVGKLLTCSGCECTYYCGTVCQKSDWKRHKQECCANLDVKKEAQAIEDEQERQWSDDQVDTYCVNSWKSEYKKNKGKTELMRFYESFWRNRGELYLLERARKELKAEMAKK